MKSLFAVMAMCAGFASAEEVIVLWPAGAPGEKAETERHDQAEVNGSDVRYVAKPRIRVFRPAAGKETGPVVVVFPGGGYNHLAVEKEGTEVCQWLNSIGITGVLLEYRVPRREGRPQYAAPLQDAQRTMGIVRSHASEWGLDPRRAGVLGFSADGYGLRSDQPVGSWPKRAEEWMRSIGVLGHP